MKLNVITEYKTRKSLKDVFSLFNKDMFYFLTKNGPVKPVRYDGDEIGDEVHLDMLFPWHNKTSDELDKVIDKNHIPNALVIN